MSNVLLVVLTAVIAFFTFLVWLVYDRIAWFTGSMDSHSAVMLRIEAARGVNGRPIEIVWWDPTVESLPFNGTHDSSATLERIYLAIPLRHRREQRNLRQRMLRTLSGRDG